MVVRVKPISRMQSKAESRIRLEVSGRSPVGAATAMAGVTV